MSATAERFYNRRNRNRHSNCASCDTSGRIPLFPYLRHSASRYVTQWPTPMAAGPVRGPGPLGLMVSRGRSGRSQARRLRRRSTYVRWSRLFLTANGRCARQQAAVTGLDALMCPSDNVLRDNYPRPWFLSLVAELLRRSSIHPYH